MDAKLWVLGIALATVVGAPLSIGAATVPAELVAQVQHRLQHARHYEVGPVDGVYGPSTHAALWFFQRENALLTTGEMDRETLRALGLGRAAARMPAAHDLGQTARDWPIAAGGGFFGTALSRQ